MNACVPFWSVSATRTRRRTSWTKPLPVGIVADGQQASTPRSVGAPRAIKRARHNSYRVKRASDEGTRHTGPPTIKLVNLRIYQLAT
jgi:hypothetical protein